MMHGRAWRFLVKLVKNKLAKNMFFLWKTKISFSKFLTCTPESNVPLFTILNTDLREAELVNPILNHDVCSYRTKLLDAEKANFS